jgi:hypothetical protein
MTAIKDTLVDIQTFITAGLYKNEEHVRLSIVARILQRLGWNIWNPAEYNAGYEIVRSDERTTIDVALFADSFALSALIKVEPPGDIKSRLQQAEAQLSQCNRSRAAPFSIITDGREWRFYYSHDRSQFPERLFYTVDLLDDSLDAIEQSFVRFLHKTQISSGRAKQEAELCLQGRRLQKVVDECLPQARLAIQRPPFPNLPESLVALLKEKGFSISIEIAKVFASSAVPTPLSTASIRPHEASPSLESSSRNVQRPKLSERSVAKPVRHIDTDHLDNLDLTHAKIIKGRICGETTKCWNKLVEIGVCHAIRKGIELAELRYQAGIDLRASTYQAKGFYPLPCANYSIRRAEATRAGKKAIYLAKLLQCEIYVEFEWQGKSPFAEQQGRIHWLPPMKKS